VNEPEQMAYLVTERAVIPRVRRYRKELLGDSHAQGSLAAFQTRSTCTASRSRSCSGVVRGINGGWANRASFSCCIKEAFLVMAGTALLVGSKGVVDIAAAGPGGSGAVKRQGRQNGRA